MNGDKEIDLFPDGKLAADLQLAGGDFVWYSEGGKMRLGVNFGLGTAVHDEAATVIYTTSIFIQIRDHSRIDFIGYAFGRSAKEGLNSTERDRSAVFVGVSFPTKINDLFKR